MPRFATDRLARSLAASPTPLADGRTRPLATVANGASRGGHAIAAVDAGAENAGVRPGMPLAEARALLPNLHTAAADGAADLQALDRLAAWCGRYTPWTAVDDSDHGLWLDVGGSAHLFGGEAALLQDLCGRLRGFGLTVHAAVADTPGAAWAAARFGGSEEMIVPPGGAASALAPLPVAALRLPAATVEGLRRLGLRRIADIMNVPRGPLTARLGGLVAKRLDQALGHAPEPLSPRHPVPPIRVRMTFAEPIATRDDIGHAARRLTAAACERLAKAQRGARRLELAAFRTDGTTSAIAVGTSRPARDAGHLDRLLAEKLDRLDPGFGIEVMILAVAVADPLPPVQTTQAALGGSGPHAGESLARLLDRLSNRLGENRVLMLAPRASHIPERASRPVAVARGANPALAPEMAPMAPAAARPIHLLAWPEPIEAVAPVPDGPPVTFCWRRRQHRIRRADGPERITPEWWREAPGDLYRGDEGTRDYYRLEDSDGGRFWVFREGPYRPGVRPKWYLHGLFP